MLKIGVTSATLTWAISRTSFTAMIQAVGRVSPGAPLVAILILSSNVFVGAARWREVMRAYGVRCLPPTSFLIHGYLVAGFYNTLVPGNIGGDALRAYAAHSAFIHPADSYVAVLLERGLGLAGLVILAGVGASLTPVLPFWWAGPSLIAMGAALAGVSMATPVVLQKFVRWLPAGTRAIVPSLTRPVGYGALGIAAGWSVVSQLVVFFASYILIHDLDRHLRILDSLALIPFAALSSYVPVSVGGLGVREAAFVILLGRVGVSAAHATAASLAFMAALLVVSALGGVAHALRPLTLPNGSHVEGTDVR